MEAQVSMQVCRLSESHEGLAEALLAVSSGERRTAAAAAAKRDDEATDERDRERELQLECLKEAQVICCQMISAGGDFLGRLGRFGAILVDEVAQATEPASIVPVLTRGCERLVLCGDHCQLPPSCQVRPLRYPSPPNR